MNSFLHSIILNRTLLMANFLWHNLVFVVIYSYSFSFWISQRALEWISLYLYKLLSEYLICSFYFLIQVQLTYSITLVSGRHYVSWYFYTLQCDHSTLSTNHLSTCKRITILLMIFPFFCSTVCLVSVSMRLFLFHFGLFVYLVFILHI